MRFARVLALALLLSVAILAGCSTGKPSDPPLVRGVITDARTNGDRSTLRVVWTEGAGKQASVDAASITVDEKTTIVAARSVGGFDRGQTLEPGDLTPGLIVEVWWSGPVAESYPVQAGAEHIEVIGEWDKAPPTPKGLEPPKQ